MRDVANNCVTLAAGLGFSPDEVAARLQEIGIDPRRRAETLSLEE